MNEYRDYECFCIHLHACRRIQKIVKTKTGKRFARYCDRRTCNAFEEPDMSDNDIWVKAEDAAKYARREAHLIKEGYGESDVYPTWEFEELDSATEGFIVEMSR